MKMLKFTNVSAIMSLLLITFATGCTVSLEGPEYPRHHKYRERHRYYWRGDTYYDQVYYIDGTTYRRVIVRENPIRERTPEEKAYRDGREKGRDGEYEHDRGRHRGRGHDKD
jgi:hypothetical protein